MRLRWCSGLIVLLAAAGAQAHHPGSHATREKDGRVKVEAVATVGDSCLAIAAVRLGTPPNVTAPAGAAPVTAEVKRAGSTGCRAAATVLRAEHLLPLGAEVRQIHLYVVGPDGAVLSTERVPLR